MTDAMSDRLKPLTPAQPSLLLYLRTLRHLKIGQVLCRIKKHVGAGLRSKEALEGSSTIADLANPLFLEHAGPAIAADEISFLNKYQPIDADGLDWECAHQSRHWRYNLHYFDYLQWKHYDNELKHNLIGQWIDENPSGTADAWDAYPISLRIVNWIKYVLSGQVSGALRTRMLTSCADQACWLEANIEYDLLANHVLKNAKALLFSGTFFSGATADRQFQAGRRLFLAEVQEQFFPDGGHYERSPMYHCISLEDLLDVIALFESNPGRMFATDIDLIRSVALSAARFLRDIIAADGEIPLTNDSAFAVAAPAPQLLEYASRILPDFDAEKPDRQERICKSDSGYFGYRRAGDSLLVSCGPISPAYQPGHTHCDMLSYELCVDGRRIIVDSGVGDYDAGLTRQYVRSTAAHNTVRVDEVEQSEIWGAFRLARRAAPIRANLSDWSIKGISFDGAHDGYRRLRGKPMHERRISTNGSDEWRVTDTLTGGSFHRLETFIHLNPDISVRQDAPEQIVLNLNDRDAFTLRMVDGDRLEVISGLYCPEFGRYLENEVVVITTQGQLPVTAAYVLKKI